MTAVHVAARLLAGVATGLGVGMWAWMLLAAAKGQTRG